MKVNVAIVGGGPGGSTCATLLKKYAPSLEVAIFERETFPRDHVGESQLPLISGILAEMGVWDKVEAANFPVKIGATYRWGKSDDLWDFHFLPDGQFRDEPRPARYAGQRLRTAFQVDRALYDEILLDHAREHGVQVYQPSAVGSVERNGRRIDSLQTRSGETVEADFYIDASGHVGFLRRALGIEVEEPSSLKNVAFWDYWQNAEWAVKLGVGGTRVQVMSLGYGWIWFIPLGPTRTSIGLVCPADYYLRSGEKPEDLYRRALSEEPRIAALLANAECEGKFATTKDWSFIAETLADENWMLVGESAGFADPILAAGLTLTHAGAREAAYTINEIVQGGDRQWLFEQYTARNQRRIRQHIRFADYWYTANAHFSELKEFTSKIAQEAGLNLDADSAFQWLGTGGFVDEDLFVGGLGTFTFNALHEINRWFLDDKIETAYGGFNAFDLNLQDAKKVSLPHYENGRVTRVRGYERDGKVLPLSGMIGRLVKAIRVDRRIMNALRVLAQDCRADGLGFDRVAIDKAMETLEALLRDGWVTGHVMAGAEPLSGIVVEGSQFVTKNTDEKLPAARRAPNLPT
jgi:flavin-dependent dehydrogenase